MKSKLPIVLLILACLGLGIGLLVLHNQAVAERARNEATIENLRDQWKKTDAALTERTTDRDALKSNLQAKVEEVEKANTVLSETRISLTQTQAEAKQTKEALDATKAELAQRDTRIQELEHANLALDKQAGDLKNAIADRESKIDDTQKRLAASEGDRDFLLKELKRLQAEKSELERQFNDLVVVKEQVRKLKEELTIARRLDWIRQGFNNAGKKGAEVLNQGFATPVVTEKSVPKLNVEINRNGTAAVVPPAPDTNAAPAAPKQ